jgi:murein DD-endopeptidase MepM/ murein hydrolase activator NlpD
MSSKRGLLDVAVTLVAIGAVYSQTPIGGIVDRGIAWAIGLEREHRPLTSFFDFHGQGRGASADEMAALIAARTNDAPELTRQAKHFGVSFALLRTLDLAGGDGGVALSDGQWQVAERLLDRRPLPGSREDRAARNVAASVAISDYARRLGSLDAGLAAFVLGPEPVERAIRLARERGAAQPLSLRAHLRYLTRAQRERAEPFVNQVMAIQTGLTFAWPIAGSVRVTSPFGERPDPFLGEPRRHNGIDIAVPAGTPVRAAHQGRVVVATYDGINGHYVKLDHGYGLTTAYCHNAGLEVRRGDTAHRAQVIASSGSSGRSTGPHLHYIVRLGGTPVDPMLFLGGE